MAMIRVSDFRNLQRPVPALLWVIARQHLSDTASCPVRQKAAHGRALWCFGCYGSIAPGESYQATRADARDGIAAHVGCVTQLVKNAERVDARLLKRKGRDQSPLGRAAVAL